MSARSAFARIPKVDAVLEAEPLASLPWRRAIKRRAVQDAVARIREALSADDTRDVPEAGVLAQRVREQLDGWSRARPKRVINATGVILHTNLGRTPMGSAAVEAMVAAAGYCDLEVSLDSGKRGSRFAWLRPFVASVLGAEDVHVVGNNAAALLLACTVLGEDGGVVLSRGQMVEIGDSFRVATMAAAGGCRVVAVGSTNRTHARDYQLALKGEGPDAAGVPASALLWCHQSNFVQQGYVREVEFPELAKIARELDVPVIADLGSGSLGAGLPETEPTITQYLEQGADLVLASGDKLLGGPQAGIIAGRHEYVHRCRRHPMSRALRPDKTTVAALHATFLAHAVEGTPELPLHRMFGLEPAALRARAAELCTTLQWSTDCIVDSVATIGGGSLPTDTIPSVALAVPTSSVNRTARRLRLGAPSVVGHIDAERLLIDLRTVDPADDDVLASALAAAVKSG